MTQNSDMDKYNKAARRQKFDRECGVWLVYRTNTCYKCFNYYGNKLAEFSLEFGSKHWPIVEYRDE